MAHDLTPSVNMYFILPDSMIDKCVIGQGTRNKKLMWRTFAQAHTSRPSRDYAH